VIRILGVGMLAVGLALLAGRAPSTSAGGSAQQKIVYDCPAGGPGTNEEICAIDQDGGNFENLSNSPLTDSGPEISPDGQHIAWLHDITEPWIMDTDGSNQHAVTDVISAFGEPTWSPDGKKIAAYCNNPDNLTVDGFCIIDVATGDVQFGNEQDFYTVEDLSWSPDGTRILFSGEQITGGADLFVLNLATGDTTNITNTDGDNEYGTWSPDGTTIAFVGNPTDADQDDDPFANLYSISPTGADRTLLYDPSSLSPSHSNPAYSPDGKTIVWFCSDSAPSAKDICFNDAQDGNLDNLVTEGDQGVVTGSNPDWNFTAGYLFGDTQCDGDLDTTDVSLLLQYAAELAAPVECFEIGQSHFLNGDHWFYGDFNCDNEVDALDALFDLRGVLGMPISVADCPAVGSQAEVFN
jgi:hypothetical protein